MNLRRQGFFREMPHGDEHDPSLEQAVNTLSQAEDVERICSYLDMGKVLIVCCGTCNDVLNPDCRNAIILNGRHMGMAWGSIILCAKLQGWTCM